MNKEYLADIDQIISHRYDNGADYWTTPDKKLLKGAPFTTLECPLYLLELGMAAEEPILKETANLIFSAWREDGRMKIAPAGGIYPCHTALCLQTLCYLGYSQDERLQKTFAYFLETQETDGGWKCNKYSFGRGPETEYSTPMTTLTILDAFRHTDVRLYQDQLNRAVEFMLSHWTIRKPISPCHYGMGSLFMQVEYPFRGYNLFYYVYVLSFYQYACNDIRYQEASKALADKLIHGQMPVERVVPKLGKLTFCKKGQTSGTATRRYAEIKQNETEYSTGGK